MTLFLIHTQQPRKVNIDFFQLFYINLRLRTIDFLRGSFTWINVYQEAIFLCGQNYQSANNSTKGYPD